VHVFWNAATGAKYYVITYNENSSLTINVTSILVTGLQPGTQYSFNVAGYGNKGQKGNTVFCVAVTLKVIWPFVNGT
jgi:hypothetical protein